jgi:hypothetical protein
LGPEKKVPENPPVLQSTSGPIKTFTITATVKQQQQQASALQNRPHLHHVTVAPTVLSIPNITIGHRHQTQGDRHRERVCELLEDHQELQVEDFYAL